MISSIRPLCKYLGNFIAPFNAVSKRLQVFGSLTDEEYVWVYGALDRTVGAPGMESSDLRPTDSDFATSGIHFSLVLVMAWILAVLLLTLPLLFG